MAAARAAQCRRRPRRPVRAAEARRRRRAARARAAAPSRRFLHQIGRRHPRTAISATISSRPCSASTRWSAIMPAPMRRARLCPAPPCLRRGGGGRGRLGPCDRRHGRDHPGDGQGGARGGRRDRPRHAGRRGHRRGRQGGRAPSPAARPIAPRRWSPACIPKLLFTELLPEGAVDDGAGAADGALGERIGDLPDERRAVRAAALHLAAGAGRSSHRRHHHRAVARLYGPRLSRPRGPRAIRASRSSRC